MREIGREGLRLTGFKLGGFNAGVGEEDRLNFENKRVASIIVDVKTPIGRIATGEEFVNVAAFLISEDATYVSGQILGVAGCHRP